MSESSKSDGCLRGDITSVADLLGLLARDSGPDAVHWYRGHDNSEWTLLPSLARDEGHLLAETDLLARFQQDAVMLIDRPVESEWQWLALMQHHGCPTRLLDWSESPLVGLFFAAVNPAYHANDGALWVLNPIKLNTSSGIKPKYPKYIPYFGDPVLESYLSKGLRNDVVSFNPVAVVGARNSLRMQAQLGVFTILHKVRITVNDVGDRSHAWWYRIPREHKPKIVRELSLLAFSKFTVFPELSSIGDRLKLSLT